ncbi:MAG: NAD(P)H-hydrate dehydratase [Clostridia bacterium]|nr:NAD(P)H-hydrate dehydratase [Clostridia bacterium]
MAEIITPKLIISKLSKRESNTSKYDYGTLLAVCGSKYYRGAAMLAASAACRCGAGIVCLASTERVISSVVSAIPECTFLPLEESENGTISHRSTLDIIARANKSDAALIGCGLALDDETRQVVQNVITSAECQLVIDADALNVLSENVELLKQARKMPVITPHFGEMARLCKKSRQDVENAPEKTALDFAYRYNCVVVLKSHVTFIATPDGKCFVNTDVGNAGLAKGGSGDVLAGMIASFLAQGKDQTASACCGVYLHGLAADKCADRLSMTSMLPSDVVFEIGSVFKGIETNGEIR